jgi:hypothetical protein
VEIVENSVENLEKPWKNGCKSRVGLWKTPWKMCNTVIVTVYIMSLKGATE